MKQPVSMPLHLLPAVLAPLVLLVLPVLPVLRVLPVLLAPAVLVAQAGADTPSGPTRLLAGAGV